MMKYNVLNRWTRTVQFTAEIDCSENTSDHLKMGLAVKWAIQNKASLAGAYLADANLAGASLAGVYLADANLVGAYLAGAYLADANLAGAYLAGAYLADANLERANLAGAYLAGANLADANLADANLERANLAGAYLAGAKGITEVVSFGPVGDERRYVWARRENGKTLITLGCHTDEPEATYTAIRKKYGKNSTYEAFVRAAVNEVEARGWH